MCFIYQIGAINAYCPLGLAFFMSSQNIQNLPIFELPEPQDNILLLVEAILLPIEREVFWQYVVEGKKHASIGRELGLDWRTVKRHYVNAREKLHSYLISQKFEPGDFLPSDSGPLAQKERKSKKVKEENYENKEAERLTSILMLVYKKYRRKLIEKARRFGFEQMDAQDVASMALMSALTQIGRGNLNKVLQQENPEATIRGFLMTTYFKAGMEEVMGCFDVRKRVSLSWRIAYLKGFHFLQGGPIRQFRR